MENALTLLGRIGQKIDKVAPDGVSTSGDLQNPIIKIINRVIAALGIVCVIVVIIGGINYMTSQGDPGKVKKARDTILYSVIGLIICALSFVIVNFVILNILKTNPSDFNGDKTACQEAGFNYKASTGECYE